MTKTINTLIKDMNEVLEGKGGWDAAITEYFLECMADFAKTRMEDQEEQPSGERNLRLSQLGKPCDRQLWYSMNLPVSEETFPPHTLMKFRYGDILEAFVLSLAKAAGHKVEGEQDVLYVDGIKGHRDAVIDGITVDVKSASSYGYQKFASGNLRDDDPFGYISQLSSYVYAGRDNDVESHPSLGAFLAVDKQNGYICLDMYDFGPELDKKLSEVQYKQEMVQQDTPPERGFTDEEDGKSGNRKLKAGCSYCDFKSVCWPGLRTFLYSGKPRFLTNVSVLPRVPESTK